MGSPVCVEKVHFQGMAYYSQRYKNKGVRLETDSYNLKKRGVNMINSPIYERRWLVCLSHISMK